jgi:hypothetical protein
MMGHKCKSENVWGKVSGKGKEERKDSEGEED